MQCVSLNWILDFFLRYKLHSIKFIILYGARQRCFRGCLGQAQPQPCRRSTPRRRLLAPDGGRGVNPGYGPGPERTWPRSSALPQWEVSPCAGPLGKRKRLSTSPLGTFPCQLFGMETTVPATGRVAQLTLSASCTRPHSPLEYSSQVPWLGAAGARAGDAGRRDKPPSSQNAAPTSAVQDTTAPLSITLSGLCRRKGRHFHRRA